MIPVELTEKLLSDAGGWGRANKVFEGKLDELVQALNEALAA